MGVYNGRPEIREWKIDREFMVDGNWVVEITNGDDRNTFHDFQLPLFGLFHGNPERKIKALRKMAMKWARKKDREILDTQRHFDAVEKLSSKKFKDNR